MTPSYNQGEFLEATIRSVLLQGYPNLEYMIMDGGSTDRSVEIIRKYEPWLSRAVSRKDNGQYCAIEEALAASTGHVMTWLNSDDMYVPNSFWAVGHIFGCLGGTVKWITGIPAMWDRDGNLGLIGSWPRLNQWLLRLGSYDGVTLPDFIQQEGTFWTRDLWERAGGRLDQGLKFGADFELWYRMARHGRLYATTLVLAGFRMHPGQKTAQFMEAYYRDIDSCRQSGPWGYVERMRLTRGIKRRVARLIYRCGTSSQVVRYDARNMRWGVWKA